MIFAELRRLDTSPRALRKFGLMVGGVFVALALLLWWRQRAWWPWLAVPGGMLVIVGAVLPAMLRRVYLAWMGLALVLGTVMSTLLLTLLFFLAVTPIGWLARLRGKDFLRRRIEPGSASYWLPRDRSTHRDRAYYERQF
jgi:hypothetical protein